MDLLTSNLRGSFEATSGQDFSLEPWTVRESPKNNDKKGKNSTQKAPTKKRAIEKQDEVVHMRKDI